MSIDIAYGLIGAAIIALLVQVVIGVRENRKTKLAEAIEFLEAGDKVRIKKHFTEKDVEPYFILDWMASARGKTLTVTYANINGTEHDYVDCEGMCEGAVITPRMIDKVIKLGGR